MRRSLNLARRPFANTRPVVRLAAFLWGMGAVLAVAAALLYWSFFQGQGEKRVELDQATAAIREERAAIADLERRLRQVDIAQENEQIAFLNQKIEERTFGWSLLFDQLATILPTDVRLLSLAPERRDDDGRRSRRRALRGEEDQGVLLEVLAQARNEEAILEMLDALFAAPAFRDPNLIQETRDAAGTIQFNLDVRYLPDRAMIVDDGEAPEAVIEERVEDPAPEASS